MTRYELRERSLDQRLSRIGTIGRPQIGAHASREMYEPQTTELFGLNNRLDLVRRGSSRRWPSAGNEPPMPDFVRRAPIGCSLTLGGDTEVRTFAPDHELRWPIVGNLRPPASNRVLCLVICPTQHTAFQQPLGYCRTEPQPCRWPVPQNSAKN